MTLEKLLALLLAALATAQVKVILGGIVADVLVNIGVSLYTGTFRLPYIANFIKSKLLPYLFGYAAVAILAYVDPKAYGAFPSVVFAFISASLLGDVLDALKQLGLPVPVFLTSTGVVVGSGPPRNCS